MSTVYVYMASIYGQLKLTGQEKLKSKDIYQNIHRFLDFLHQVSKKCSNRLPVKNLPTERINFLVNLAL